MTRFVNVHQLEADLKYEIRNIEKAKIIDRLISKYAYTNIHRAKELITEQYALLKEEKTPPLEANYHLYAAFIENQFYNYPIAEHHFKEALSIIKDGGDLKQQAELYIDFAGIYINLDKLKEAHDYVDKAREYLNRYPDKILRGRLICREGYINLYYGDYGPAVEKFLEADKEFNTVKSPLSLKDYYFLSLIHSGLGNCYEQSSKDMEKGVKNYLKALEICHENNLGTRLSWHYLNVGKAFMGLNNLAKAEQYYRRAIEITDILNNDARGGAYANLGYCYFLQKRYEEVPGCYDMAEQLYRENPETNYSNFVNIENWRAKLHTTLGDRAQAEQHFIKAFSYANKKGDGEMYAEICRNISGFYAEIEDYKNAYDYLVLNETVKQKRKEKLNSRKILELEVKYESEKRRQEAEMLRLQASSLQLKALRAQMNPHFMYNALNSIQNYITSNELKDASRYLAKFAHLMRQSLDYSDLEVISLEKEVQFLGDYLMINEKLRFRDKLKHQIIIDPEIEPDIFGIPTMIVQPYVENAIEHGLRSRDMGVVKIEFQLIDDFSMLCIVEDNGIGRDKARELQSLDDAYRKHESKGTKITEERLRVLHNHTTDRHYIKTLDLIDNFTKEPIGTRVEILIPIVEIQLK